MKKMIQTFHIQRLSIARLPISLTKGRGHFVTISNLVMFEPCPKRHKLSKPSSLTDNLEERNPCQYLGSRSKKASNNLLVPFKSSFNNVSIPNE